MITQWKLIVLGIMVLGLVTTAWVHIAGDRRTQRQLAALTEQAADVLTATRAASDNPKLKWEGTAGQVAAMGETIRTLKVSIETQNQAIDELAEEAVRLRAKASELKHIADKAEAQRATALERLSNMALTPGTRDDCMTLLREAEDALDTVREAGL
jgi:hypothetical protein